MRLIDADSLKYRKTSHSGETSYYIYDFDVKQSPTIDAVQVVRCINCIHRISDEGDEDYDRYRCSKTGLNYGPYFYCAEGYRRMDGDTE